MSTTAQRSDELRQSLLRRIERDELELPILPDVASRVLSLCQDPDGDASKLSTLIQSDPALAGNVLRIANSAAYAAREPIVSLQQAVSRLGMTAMGDIAVAAAVNNRVFNARGREADMKALRTHAAATGIWAREIARLRRRNVEAAFLTGLLHDVGKPILLQAALEITKSAPVDEETLSNVIHSLHATMGAHVLNKWKLAHWMAAAIDGHHDIERAGEHSDLAATVQLADLFAHWSVNSDPERERKVRECPVLAMMGLYPEDLDVLFGRKELVVNATKAFT